MFKLPAVIATLAFAQATNAQQDTARIPRVVVTATRSPLATERVPASVSVVSGARLRQEGIAALADALRQVPGATVAQTAGYGTATSLFLRGGESKYTKVLVDGVPVNDAGGAFDFSSIPLDNVERIEIVRGPASVLYGSDAVAGVVQVFTRRGAPGAHGDAVVRGGSFGTRDLAASVRGMTSAVEYSLGAASHRTAGIQLFNSHLRDDVLSVLLGTSAGGFDARVTGRLRDAEVHYPTNGSGEVVDSNAMRREGRLALGLDAGHRVNDAAELRLALASHGVHAVSEDQPDSPGDVYSYNFTNPERSWRRSGDLRLKLDLGAMSRVTIGAQTERQWQESFTTSNYGDASFTATRRTSGAYAQLLLSPSSRYTLTLGSRFDHSETFGEFRTWRAAAVAELLQGTRVRGSIGTAFREPTFVENFGGGFAIGNPNLDPEQSRSADVGIEHTLGEHATVGATWFTNSFRDLIDYRYSATQPNYWNVARTRTGGLELEARVAAGGAHADAAFTYLQTRVVDPGVSAAGTAAFVAGDRLLRRPMHTLDVGAGYRVDRAGLDVRALRVGSRPDVYYAPDFTASRVTLPAYTRVDLSGDVTVVPRVVVTLRAENLLDARYSDVAGYNSDFKAGVARELTGYRAPGRRVLGGVRMSF